MQLLLNIFFYAEDCVAASDNISYFLRNVRLLLKDIIERLLLKENVQHIVLLYVEDSVAASRCLSMFFKELATASKRYQ